MDFVIPQDHRVKIKESKKINKYLDLAGELKICGLECNGDPKCSWCTWNGPQRPGKETGGTGDQRKN